MTRSQVQSVLGVVQQCPDWMDTDPSSRLKDWEKEEDLNDDDDDDSISSVLFFQNIGENNESTAGGGEINNKEEIQVEDQEDLEVGDR